MIPAKNYINRRAKLAQSVEQPMIVLAGSDQIQRSSDDVYEFHQDGYFYYLTGIDEPGWTLVMDVKKGREFLIAAEESAYNNPEWQEMDTIEDIKTKTGIDDVRIRRDGWAYIRKSAENYQSIGSLVPKQRFIRPYGMFINPAKVQLVERLRRLHSDANLIDIGADIRSLRGVKEPEEIEEIRKSIAITKLGFDNFVKEFDTYKDEAEIVSDFDYIFTRNGATQGYHPIVASGPRTALAHYKKNTAKIEDDHIIQLDIGACQNRYSADISRVYEVGNPTQRHRDIIQAVHESFDEAINYLKPGITMRAWEMHIEQFIGTKLNQLGLIDTMLRQDIRKFYPHAISHHLGVDLHDSCDYVTK